MNLMDMKVCQPEISGSHHFKVRCLLPSFLLMLSSKFTYANIMINITDFVAY